MHGSGPKDLYADLKDFDVPSTVIRFTPTQPLSSSLVERIVATRFAQVDGARA